MYTILWIYVNSRGEETKGYTTLLAQNEAEAEKKFYETHKKLTPMNTSGYDVYNIWEESI